MWKFIDITGWIMREHGVPSSRITVLRRVEDYISPNGYVVAQWECQCDCGKTFVSSGKSIRSGKTKSCGCLQKEKASLLNENLRIRNDNNVITHKKCYFCNELKEIAEFHHNKCTADGYTNMCKECSRHTVERRYKNYKQGAKSRDLDFNLSKEEFDEITKMPCKYCGEYSGVFLGVYFCGIDRIDSNIGYVKDNVVPCCEICNRMKLDYKFDDWVNKMKKILNHLEEHYSE